jgi:flagellar basal-body rod protein FlgB
MADFNVFDALSRRIDWLQQRQTVLSKNISNANTPGYRPQDLETPAFEGALKRELKPMSPEVTNPRHVNASVPAREKPESDESEDTYETAPSGNAVIVEEQMVKVADTQMSHQEMTSLYRKNGQLVKIALGKGR